MKTKKLNPTTESIEAIDIERVKEIVKFSNYGNGEIVETDDFIRGIRHALLFFDSLSQSKMPLTPMESYCASDVISRVVDIMTYDKENGEYTDSEGFVFSCSPSDFAALKRAYKKL